MKIKKRIFSLALAGTMALGLMPGMTMTALADGDTSYTLTIPSTLTVEHKGWNATDGISATGSLESGKKLSVTATSDDEFALVNQSDNTQKVGYILAATSEDTTATTSWTFDSLSNTATTKTMGIIVEDYSSKPAGTYQDTVTFTACVRNETIIWTEQTFNDNREGEFTADGITVTPTYNGANYPRYSNWFYSWGYNQFTAPEGKKFTKIVIESSGEIELVDFSGATYTADFPTREEATEIVKKMYGDYYEEMYEMDREMIEEEIQNTMNRADSIITTWTGSTDTIRFRAGIENVSKITFTLE